MGGSVGPDELGSHTGFLTEMGLGDQGMPGDYLVKQLLAAEERGEKTAMEGQFY